MSRITRRSVVPVNQITPLTYRDGVTYIQMLTQLSEYIKSVLHPSLQHTVDQIVADVETQMDKHHDQYVDGVQEFQRIHDAFMADVNAHLMALNDQAVADLVNDDTSMLGQVLRGVFVDRGEFTELSGSLELRQTQLRQELNQRADALEAQHTQFQNTFEQTFSESVDDFQRQIYDIRDAAAVTADPEISAALVSGNATIVMTGSSTTRLHEFPQEFARQIHAQYHSGVFERIDDVRTPLQHGTHIINAGWGGSAGADYIYPELAEQISSLNPNIVVHAIGSNDWRHGRNPDNLADQIDDAINRLHSNKKMFHVLFHQHERLNVPSSVPYTWDDYLDALYDAASRGPNRVVVDGSQDMRLAGAGVGLDDRYNFIRPDGIHLTLGGHKALGQILARKLGFLGGGGVTDTGWQEISPYVTYHPNTSQGTNEPVMIRIVSDGGGTTTYIRGLLQRASDATAFFTIKSQYRDLILPKNPDVYGPNNRHLIGTFTTSTGGYSGLVHLRDTGGVIRLDTFSEGIGERSTWLDLTIRGG